MRNAQVRATYRGSLGLVRRRSWRQRFRLAKKAGEIDAKADPGLLAELADSIMFALAVRARSGGKPRCA